MGLELALVSLAWVCNWKYSCPLWIKFIVNFKGYSNMLQHVISKLPLSLFLCSLYTVHVAYPREIILFFLSLQWEVFLGIYRRTSFAHTGHQWASQNSFIRKIQGTCVFSILKERWKWKECISPYLWKVTFSALFHFVFSFFFFNFIIPTVWSLLHK